MEFQSLDAPLRWEDWSRFRQLRKEAMTLGERLQPYVAGIYILAFLIIANVLVPFMTLDNKEQVLALMPVLSAGLVLLYLVIFGSYVLSLRPQVRLARWAARNRLAFGTYLKNYHWDGSLFPRDVPSVTNYIVAGGWFEIANYRQLPGGDGRTNFWMPSVTFLKLSLPYKVPHALLTTNASSALARQWVAFSRERHVELAGDFNKNFSLYCAAGSERAVQEILTTDLMAKILAVSNYIEIELKGDEAYLYFGKRVRLDRSEAMRRILVLARSVAGDLYDHSGRYDESRRDAEAELSGDELKKHNIAQALGGTSVAKSQPTKRRVWHYLAIGLSWVAGYFLLQYFFGA